MRFTAPAILLAILLHPLCAAAAPDSVYTQLDSEKDCKLVDEAKEDEGGDWAEFHCEGYRDYPVYLSYGDARESAHYGYAPGGKPDSWESFGGFNSVSKTVEWRIEDGVPFATIHRWTINDASTDKEIQVLVVEKVAQPDAMEGCVVGYVVATGNPDHNVQAREVADQYARDFSCWSNEPLVREGSVPLPGPSRSKTEQ